ncbi:MAG: AEC family transporter, partial [Desulfococcaceae bacterium]
MALVLNGLFPVFALLVLGRLLRRFEMTTAAFLATSDRLIYFIFFPAMLFWKIGGARTDAGIPADLVLASVAAILTLYAVSTLYIWLAVGNFEAGSFSQSCYRFNTYIGMAIIVNALGDEGVRLFGLLVGIVIPLINVLAVSTLIWFSGREVTGRERFRLTLRALISNPLILACLAGLLYARTINMFPSFVDRALGLASSATLPLALLSIGGALTLDNLRGHLGLSVIAAGFKLVIFPLVGYGFLRLFGVTGTAFHVGMIFFALPTSTAIYVLSSQLNSNTELASAAVVMSTLLSFVSLTLVLTL